MANWVKNKVKITGPDEDVEMIFDLLTKDFLFSRILPIPEEVNLVSGTVTDEAIRAYMATVVDEDQKQDFIEKYGAGSLKRMRDEYPSQFSFHTLKQVAAEKDHGLVFDAETDPGGLQDYILYGKQYVENLFKYGARTWYDWCIKNWGTKWPARDVEFVDKGHGFVRYAFETAWDPPVGIFEIILKQFPTLRLDIQYADEDIGSNCGEFVGGVNDAEWINREGDIEFAEEVWGVDE